MCISLLHMAPLNLAAAPQRVTPFLDAFAPYPFGRTCCPSFKVGVLAYGFGGSVEMREIPVFLSESNLASAYRPDSSDYIARDDGDVEPAILDIDIHEAPFKNKRFVFARVEFRRKTPLRSRCGETRVADCTHTKGRERVKKATSDGLIKPIRKETINFYTLNRETGDRADKGFGKGGGVLLRNNRRMGRRFYEIVGDLRT